MYLALTSTSYSLNTHILRKEFSVIYLNKTIIFMTFTDGGHCLSQKTQIPGQQCSILAGLHVFQYILPTEPIYGTRQPTGLSVDGELLLHLGHSKDTTDIQSAMHLFSAQVKIIPNCDFSVLVHALNCAGVHVACVNGTKQVVVSPTFFQKVIAGKKSYKEKT